MSESEISQVEEEEDVGLVRGFIFGMVVATMIYLLPFLALIWAVNAQIVGEWALVVYFVVVLFGALYKARNIGDGYNPSTALYD